MVLSNLIHSWLHLWANFDSGHFLRDGYIFFFADFEYHVFEIQTVAYAATSFR